MPAPTIVEATRSYERWLARQTRIVRADLARKHRRMAESPFVFLRGTFYRWIQLWLDHCADLACAPALPSVGDLHVENFGTWRDAEGRLAWGVNDVDEACVVSYANDLVRLATSATLAAREQRLHLSLRSICAAVLEGYTSGLAAGGEPIVLENRHRWLRRLALSDARAAKVFWQKCAALRPAGAAAPRTILKASLPDRRLPFRACHRVAGVGSLGRQRVVALAEWNGAPIAREAKAFVTSAAVWATGRRSAATSGVALLARAIRASDPFYEIRRGWIVRRLAADCSRIELDQLPRERDEARLLRAMGWEVANLHLGKPVTKVSADLKGRPRDWLTEATRTMTEVTVRDWQDWKTRST